MAAEPSCRRNIFPAARRVAFWLTVLLAATLAHARDVYVLLSGGGTPLTNNYSQYLQASAVAQHLRETYPADSVWTFFGQGNRPGEPVQLADVHRQVKENGLLRESWLAGVLPGNRSARKEVFLVALRDEVLPAVHDGGTLYLFIGDHGALAKKEPKESVVTMWQMEHKGADERSWRTNPEQELSVAELRAALDAGLGKGRVVFCMTQCHSGGFHFLGVPRDMRPSPDWFLAHHERSRRHPERSHPHRGLSQIPHHAGLQPRQQFRTPPLRHQATRNRTALIASPQPRRGENKE